MLSLFDKRVYAFRATWTTAFFYSRFYSAVAISFRIYLVFSQIFVFRGIVSFFLLPRNFSKRCRRFTLHANSRSTRVKPVQPPGENMSTRRENKVLFSVFFLLLSWVFNQACEMIEFRIDNDRDNCEEKINKLLEWWEVSGYELLSRYYLFFSSFYKFNRYILQISRKNSIYCIFTWAEDHRSPDYTILNIKFSIWIHAFIINMYDKCIAYSLMLEQMSYVLMM